eukprot:6197957-Pleurochrysis_carterae.AAC.1
MFTPIVYGKNNLTFCNICRFSRSCLFRRCRLYHLSAEIAPASSAADDLDHGGAHSLHLLSPNVVPSAQVPSDHGENTSTNVLKLPWTWQRLQPQRLIL